MDTREILEKLKNDEITLDNAEHLLKSAPFLDLKVAKLDSHRKVRTGFSEVIYCENKENEILQELYGKLFSEDGEVLGTRASEEQYNFLKTYFPEVQYDPVSRIMKIESENKARDGKVSICSAGAADMRVAEEAAQVAEFFGTKVNRIYDIGVSGIHRLFVHLEDIQTSNCIVVVAGMEGALASVIGGLVSTPVVAVPTSVGYGASLGGISALLTMINSCANAVSVVNIDNGFGAGYISTQINRLAQKGNRSL